MEAASFLPVKARAPRRTRTTETLSGGSVQVWGENVYYEAAGGAEGNPTVLFLHESGGSLSTWDGQLVGLAQRARCLALDLPGHGRSEGVGFTSVTEYRDAILGFLDALAIRWPVVLAGVCLGAAIAVDIAVHAPDRVSGLVLAGISEGGRACEAICRKTARGEAPEAFVDRLFSHHVSPRIRDARMQRWKLTSPLVRHWDLRAMRSYPMEEALQRVPKPALLTAGELDSLASPEATRVLAGTMQDAVMAEVPRAGCLAMVEQPGLFNEVMARYVAGLASTVMPVADQGRSGGYRRFR